MKKTLFNYRHYIFITITLGFVSCAVFLFPNALGRIIEGFRDIGLSIAYYFCEMFGIKHSITPTVINLPKFPFFDFGGSAPSTPTTPLPDTFDGFKTNWTAYWQTFITKSNVLGYMSFLGNLLYYISYALLIIIPLFLVFRLLFARYLRTENNDYNKDSKALRAFKKFALKTYYPIKRFVVELIDFAKTHTAYIKIWLFIWAFNFNIITIFLELVAYYLYFAVSFNIGSIYIQVYKLFLDLSAPLTFIPLWAWAILGLVLFLRFRKNIALMKLRHMEMRNRGFINERPIVVMTCGTMGKKKTTMITDMVLSQAVMFRDKAFEKILENDLKFPYFPWINLEKELQRAMQFHEVYNLATCKLFVHKKCRRWQKNTAREKVFDYDYKRYGLFYDDKLKVADIWEVLEVYAQLYFIYIIQSSLLIANYSIRTDNLIQDLGNFPLWNTDFFSRDSRFIDSYSRHSHILDFDALRLGRKVLENNANKDVFEFGVVVITEVGKERGNTIEQREVKKKADEANQKNDLFNTGLKMIRHSATVDNFPFVKVITDEQRPTSWGADARDLADIVHIRESYDTTLALPFFALEELLYSWLLGKFRGLYLDYRFKRGDNTLFLHIMKTLASKLDNYYKRIYNQYGYCILRVQLESGTMDGQLDESKYYIMNKKIYSKRFSTDCFSEYFTNKSLRSSIGLTDLSEYETEKATFEELKEQNSYFINDLVNTENKESEE